MGKYVNSGLIQGIRGQVGEYVFSYWKGIPVISKKAVKKRDPRTASQLEVRRIHTELVKRWNDMSFSEWALWGEYAKRYKGVKMRQRQGLVPCIGGKMGGNAAYISVNQLLMGCGFKALEKPFFGALKPPLVSADLSQLGVYSSEIRFNVWLPYSYGCRCVVQVWVERTGKGRYPYLRAVVPVDISKKEVVVDEIRVKEDGKIVEKKIREVGRCKLFLQLRTVAENGEFSMPSQIYKVEGK